jgi:glycosyltransferase involved in cell wall biosynthesis
MTKRVCLVGPVYPYRGGIAHFTSVLAKEFGQDHDVLVVSFKRLYPSFLFPGKTQFDKSGEPLDVPSKRLIDSMNPFSFWSAARSMRSFRPDLIVFQWWHPFFAIAYATIVFLLGGTLKRNVVFLCHNVLPHERSLVDTILIRLGFSQVSRFLVQSEEDRDSLLNMRKDAIVGVHPHPIYDAFNKGRHTRESARREIGIDGRVVLFFGLIRPYKGLQVLIQAFAKTVRRMEATLLIVGEFYENMQPYVTAIERLGIEKHVRVLDRYVPNEEVEKYFVACDVVVLPYLSATQSGITQIAFGFDKPVVVTRVGGLPDVVEDGVTGFVVTPGDPDALTDALLEFFQDDVARRMQDGVSKAKHRFSWLRCGEILWELAETPSRR